MKKFLFRKIALFPVFFLILAQLDAVPLYSQQNTPPEANLLNLNLKDADIKDALKIISQASGLNIVVDKNVSANINITLKEVTWETALDTILRTNDLTYKTQDNIIRITTPDTIKKEEEVISTITKIYTLNFAKADELQKSLSKMLSSRGSMEADVPTNSLIINDIPDVIEKIEDLAKKLDIRTPQVLIEALIMSVKLKDTDKLGIDWTVTHKDKSYLHSNQTLIPSSSVLDLYYGKTIFPAWNLTSHLALFAEDSDVKILATPRILTLDNLAAQIEITEQVPYTYTAQSTEGSSTVSSTQFKETGIKLYVTPHITKTAERFISLSVKTEQSYVASYVGSTNEPAIDSRKAETNLMLKDNETVVIGGLRKKDQTVTIDKIPLLGDIPLLGKIFSRTLREETDTELIVFITPRIIEGATISEEERERLRDSRSKLFTPMKRKEKPTPKDQAMAAALEKGGKK